MTEPENKHEIIARAQRAKQALEEIEPYMRAVEAFYTEKLIAISGWKALWRGDRRRAEASARIQALRDVRMAVNRVIDAGTINAGRAPKGIV